MELSKGGTLHLRQSKGQFFQSYAALHYDYTSSRSKTTTRKHFRHAINSHYFFTFCWIYASHSKHDFSLYKGLIYDVVLLCSIEGIVQLLKPEAQLRKIRDQRVCHTVVHTAGWTSLLHTNCSYATQAQTQGGCRGCIPPPDLKRCWHDTWFHWKSSLKYFCTAHYSLKMLQFNLC